MNGGDDMGHYLNVGNEGFQRALRAKIYVDKSGLIAYTNDVMNTDDCYICVSRPRRFGKSMTANMLVAYYDKSCESKELFRELDISRTEKYEEHLNRHDVIFLNIQQILSRAGNAESIPGFIEKVVLEELKIQYPELVSSNSTYLPAVLETIFKSKEGNNQGFVFIIDEWDCIFREAKDDIEAQKKYLDFLKDLFKDRTYVALAYMTGILPIKKYGTHSALNIFREYSMTDPGMFAKYVGFTQTEVKQLCDEYGMDFESVKIWYDGYVFGDDLHIYNPKSVLDAMKNEKLKSFWVSTETYEALQIYIDLDLEGLKETILEMLSGNSCKIDTGTFQNDMTSIKSKDDVLTLLIHLGYLAYDENTQKVYIPNEEVRGEFLRAIKNGNRPELIRLIRVSDEILAATIQMDGEAVGKLFEEIHSMNVSPDFYNNEQALRSVVRMGYLSSIDEYVQIQELPSGKGYVDLVFWPRKGSEKPLMIVELKWNKKVDGAISQIKKNRYIQAIERYGGEILLVGINYDAKSKKHECVIEKYEK